MIFEDDKDEYDDSFDNLNIISATDCTGLMPTPPMSIDEWESYQTLYATELTSGIEKSEPEDKNP